MIELRNIKKAFDGREVLKGISLDVNDGEVVALLGPSGSGKTTLLRCVNFLERADAGEMIFNGKTLDLKHASKKDVLDIRRKTAFVFQNYGLFLNKTALQNVMEGLVVVQKKSKEEARAIALNALEWVGLPDKLNSWPSQLSGGEQQRVSIARAIALQPEVILFDEPTSALDPELVGGVLEVIKKVAKSGITMMVVTHEMKFAEEVANKIVFMDDGYVVETGSSREIFSNPKEDRTKKFLARVLKQES